MIKVAFDIDDTLWKIVPDNCTDPVGAPQMMCLCGKHFRQAPDYDLIQVLRWFHQNGDKIYVWSAGGVDYAKMIVTKLGLNGIVEVIPKGEFGAKNIDIDLTFDDDVAEQIGKVNCTVKREPHH